MYSVPARDPNARALTTAIQRGDTTALQQQLAASSGLAAVRIFDADGSARTLLHIAADWPGHFPNGAAIVAVLIGAGVAVDAPMIHAIEGRPPETALHWAASSDDVAVLDALLDGGANIEAPGASFTLGTPMSDAVVFAQWRAARRLLERGASTTIWQAAALGLLDRVSEACRQLPPPSPADITNAFWHACRGGQRDAAEFLMNAGADHNWMGYEHKTPLDAAYGSDAVDLISWLISVGGTRGGVAP